VYDFESMLTAPNEKGEREHVVNFICATHRCQKCKDKEEGYKCMVCGNRENGGVRDFTFTDLPDFINHALQERPQFDKVIILAHNSSRYDLILAAKTIIKKQKLRRIYIS